MNVFFPYSIVFSCIPQLLIFPLVTITILTKSYEDIFWSKPAERQGNLKVYWTTEVYREHTCSQPKVLNRVKLYLLFIS